MEMEIVALILFLNLSQSNDVLVYEMTMTVSDSFIFHETFTASQAVIRTNVQNTKSGNFNRKVKVEYAMSYLQIF